MRRTGKEGLLEKDRTIGTGHCGQDRTIRDQTGKTGKTGQDGTGRDKTRQDGTKYTLPTATGQVTPKDGTCTMFEPCIQFKIILYTVQCTVYITYSKYSLPPDL